MKINQTGSSMLIVVLIISVITVIAVSAMRSALTAKEQVVNSLIDHILDVENITAIAHIASMNKSSASNIAIHTRADGHTGNEIVFCAYANRANNYSDATYSIMRWISGAPNRYRAGADSDCNVEDTRIFTTDRKATLTQVAVRRSSQSASELTGGKVTSGKVYVITATTLMPGFNKADESSMNQCINLRTNNSTMITTIGGYVVYAYPVVTCLRNLGVPARSATQTYVR